MDKEEHHEHEGRILRPAEVAERLSASPAAVRRYAKDYEQVFGPLPRQGEGRAWPVEAVQRIEGARRLLDTGQVKSLATALEMLRDGRPTPLLRRPEPVEDLLTLVLEMQHEATERLSALESDLASLRKLVEEALENRHRPALAQGSDARTRELEAERDELQRRLQGLEAELRRWWPWKGSGPR